MKSEKNTGQFSKMTPSANQIMQIPIRMTKIKNNFLNANGSTLQNAKNKNGLSPSQAKTSKIDSLMPKKPTKLHHPPNDQPQNFQLNK
jgi:hypothetical protein